ncbi:DUF1127 domain-containing protein [Leptolyngbya sp. 15MV]|nr:DUF1127 domain-containing protein [Leptolyngbya sp. 15MV]
MNPRDRQEQIGLFHATPSLDAASIETIRAQAVAARDAAMAQLLVRVFGPVFRGVALLLTWPRRRATYETLRLMSDRQLADIGLERAEIARVFEPDFRLPAQVANSNLPAPARVA